MPLFSGAVDQQTQNTQGSGFTQTSPITGLDPKDPLGLFPKQGVTAPTVLDPTQLGGQTDLIAQFQQIIGQLQPLFDLLPQLGQQLGGQAQGFVDQAGQAGQGLQPFTEQDQFLPQQLAGAQGVVQNFLNQNLNQVTGQSNLAGQSFGGRSQVLKGTAIGQASVGLGSIFSDIFASDILRRQDAATSQGVQELGGAQLGLSGLTDIMDLISGGLAGQFGGVNQLQSLLGPPQQVGGGGTGGGGGGGGVVGGILGAFSDIRLKENIVKLGELPSGQPFYAFNYKGYPQCQFIGVMAQESPDGAVLLHESGYLMVDYGRIH